MATAIWLRSSLPELSSSKALMLANPMLDLVEFMTDSPPLEYLLPEVLAHHWLELHTYYSSGPHYLNFPPGVEVWLSLLTTQSIF
ncbi:hypothetical protein K7X08_015079 [Anisodus acutangulus]|uniref:Uncharacterized protein n=1 Tax=Anisodus acutangulus TaxID=402998 RepID=A0A9Q1L620_9SOLA|nr:hypothetical protein K7X08_015079 [Anisodus acutangulus]